MSLNCFFQLATGRLRVPVLLLLQSHHNPPWNVRKPFPCTATVSQSTLSVQPAQDLSPCCPSFQGTSHTKVRSWSYFITIHMNSCPTPGAGAWTACCGREWLCPAAQSPVLHHFRAILQRSLVVFTKHRSMYWFLRRWDHKDLPCLSTVISNDELSRSGVSRVLFGRFCKIQH